MNIQHPTSDVTFFIDRNKRSPSSTKMSPLFLKKLPAEIRNIIYRHVLTSEGGLSVHLGRLPGNGAPHYVVGDINWNRLKYVNSQLRRETEDLELQFNKLTFSGDGKIVRQVLHFINLLQERGKLSLVRLIEITPVNDDYFELGYSISHDYKNMMKLDEICQQYPALRVCYHVHGRLNRNFPHPSLIEIFRKAELLQFLRNVAYTIPEEFVLYEDPFVWDARVQHWKKQNFPSPCLTIYRPIQDRNLRNLAHISPKELEARNEAIFNRWKKDTFPLRFGLTYRALEARNLRFHLYGVDVNDKRLQLLIQSYRERYGRGSEEDAHVAVYGSDH
ncbi:hypothetical protein DM02DRAFT_627786 [Periconia macrospinosa]|uniref:Uncharacterized protein n=1 Tax=Periconia macrospinosa TaxID=97972 RepID=A0A2V1DTC1_9PLEO|nr:hypothetical protein DM02DRAFT_627786 [Periconia macrospinosa]